MRVIFLCVTVLAATTICRAYDFSTNPGDGSEANPYQINSPEHLTSIGSDPALLDKHFVLTADIDMAAYTGTQYNIIGSTAPFTGVFDGRGYHIWHLTYVAPTTSYIGLFGHVNHASLLNLNVDDVYLEAASFVGGLVGSASDSDIFNCTTSGSVSGTGDIGGLLGWATGTVRNCHSEADVNGDYMLGGLIGYSYYSAISNCTTTGTVMGTGDRIGGIVGSSWGTIKNCHSSSPVSGAYYVGGLAGHAGGIGDFMIRCSASGSVTGINIDSHVVGGLMGQLGSGTVRRCFAEGSVTCTGTSSSSVGGFVGSGGGGNYPAAFYDCYASGNVIGHTEVGGFAGRIGTTTLQPCVIATCYSTGLVEGDSGTGGFLGLNTRADTVFEGLFWDMDTSQTSNGIASQNPDPDGIIGLETLAMKHKSSFLGWDFVGEDTNGKNEIWRMCIDGVDTPRLSWEFAQRGDFACGDGVDILDLQALAQNWLTAADSTPATFNHACDANGDGQIDLLDYAVLSQNWQ